MDDSASDNAPSLAELQEAQRLDDFRVMPRSASEGKVSKAEADPAKAEAEPTEEEYSPPLESRYSQKPSIVGQFTNKPETLRRTLAAAFFVIPDQMEDYNSLLTKASAADPEVFITGSNEHFHAGKFYVKINYQKIEYLQL